MCLLTKLFCVISFLLFYSILKKYIIIYEKKTLFYKNQNYLYCQLHEHQFSQFSFFQFQRNKVKYWCLLIFIMLNFYERNQIQFFLSKFPINLPYLIEYLEIILKFVKIEAERFMAQERSQKNFQKIYSKMNEFQNNETFLRASQQNFQYHKWEVSAKKNIIIHKIPMKNQLRQIKQVSSYEYDQNCVLGEGTYAKVYAGKRKANNMPVAVKVIKEQFFSQKAMKYLFDCEIQAARKLSHPNIVTFFEVVREEGMCYIFMQKCQTKNLRSLIKKQGPIQETQALQIFEGIVNGYLYLTKNKVLHRDLKPSNILFRRNGQPLIADFGFCDFLDSPNRPKYYTVGSMNYMAPQSYVSQQYSEKSDVWSLGVILYEMLKGHPLKMLSKKEQKHFKILVKTEYPIVDQNFSLPFINDLLKGCLATQKKKRISIVKIKEIIQKWREENSIEANFCQQNLNLLNDQQTSKQIKLIKIESQKNIEKIMKQQEPKILRKASQKTFKPKTLLLRPPSIATTTSSKKSYLSKMKRNS